MLCIYLDSPKFPIAQTVVHHGLAFHGYRRRIADDMNNRYLKGISLMQIVVRGIKLTYSAYCPATPQYADSSPGPKVVTKAPIPLTRA